MTEASVADLDASARQILIDNDRGGYTVPTKGLYPYQWNWDSVFAAWGFATYDIDRAWTEIETLFSAQWDDGMLPHIVFWKIDPGYFPGPDVWGAHKTPPSSGISQPPVTAILARLIHAMDPEEGERRLRALWPGLRAAHRWWRTHRCATGVAAITHPWESGRDNCADWDIGMRNVDGSGIGEYHRRDTGHVDASMRPLKEDYDRYLTMVKFGRDCGWDQAEIVANGPFLMADPAITFILLRAHRDLAAIGRILGEDVNEVETWAAELEAGLPQILNPETGVYDARDLRTGQFAGGVGSGAFLAWLVGIHDEEMDKRLMGAWDGVRYGIPSTDPRTEAFEPRRYWRGPTWTFLNALIAMGLRDAGRFEEEERLRQETEALIRIGGFSEYHDPMDGTPCGGPHFTWTAAAWLTWASPSAKGG